MKEKVYENAILLPEIISILNEGKTVTLRLRGNSMRPFLEDNRDKALMKKAEHFKVGDPVLAEVGPKHFVLHRIVRIDNGNVTLRGDGNLGVEHCSTADVKAEIIGFYRKGRDKLDLVNGRKWKIYSFFWMHLSPIRRYLLAFYRRIWIPLFGPM